MGRILRLDNDKIRSLRIQRGWPLEQLAKIADVSPRTIQIIEAGGDASFETLRSVAGAFQLTIHELMREAPQLDAAAEDEHSPSSRLSPLDSSLISSCIPYLPIIKMTFGSLALVLLASGAIRLAPFFLAFLDPDTNIGEPYKAVSQHSQPAAPARGLANASSPRLLFREIMRAAAHGTAALRLHVATVRRPDTPPATDVSAISEKGGGQFLTATIVTELPADFSSLKPRVVKQLQVRQIAEPALPDPRLTTAGESAGLAGHAEDDGISLSKSFARSGKGAAILFARVGGSIKRAF